MKQLIISFCLITGLVDILGQGAPENRNGQISFVSSQHIYVRFASTSGISVGDTLFILSDGALNPAFVVINLSTTSCICANLTNVTPVVADPVVAKIKPTINKPVAAEATKNAIVILPPPTVTEDSVQPYINDFKQHIHGSFSASTYVDFSNTIADDSYRFKYTLSLNARNIANSRFSAESYVSFRHKKDQWSDVKSDIHSALKIYSLSVRYDMNKTTQISLGRKINPSLSNIGATDGLQVEKTIRKFALGALIGTRPDYYNYSFNSNLFQYGAYVAFNTKKERTHSGSSVAFMEQMNHWKTDRRFIYFQHTNSLIKNLYTFFSFEADLYQLTYDTLGNEVPRHSFSPTALYVSLRYKLTNKLTISGSYDARKNVVYYESYKTLIDTLLEKEMRQGFRLQANYRITKNLAFGIQSGYRYLKSDPRASKNINGYLTYSHFQGLDMSATLSATFLETSYMTGKIAGINLSKDLLKGKIHTGIGYRYIDYQLSENLQNLVQHNVEVSLDWQFYKKLSLSTYYEATFEPGNSYNRIYGQVRMRF